MSSSLAERVDLNTYDYEMTAMSGEMACETGRRLQDQFFHEVIICSYTVRGKLRAVDAMVPQSPLSAILS